MINLGLIGQHGKLGLYLQQHLTFDYIFGRNNFIDIPGTNINILICAAPSANIEEINSGIKTATGQLAHELDMEATLFFMDHLRQSTIQKFFLVSPQYILDNPNTRFSVNRRFLESWVKQNIPNYVICRKSTKEEVLEEIKKFINE